MTPEEIKAKEQIDLIEKINTSIGEKYPFLKDSKKTIDLITDLEQKLSKVTSSEEYEKFKAESVKQFEDLGMKLKGIIENPAQKNEGYKSQISTFFKEKAEELKTLYKSPGKSLELNLKAVGDMSTAAGSIVGAVPQYPIWGAPDFNLIGNFIDQFITVTSTNMPNFPYTEMLPKDGNFAFVLEGGIKPQIDFKWETRYVNPTKIAAWEKLSEEVVTDIPRMESLANQLLLKKHNIKKQRAIISGTGTAPEPKGLIRYGRAFNLTHIGGLATVVAPNIFDVINACILDIAVTHNYVDEMPYTANFVGMNPIDYFRYIQTAKDADKRPLYNYDPLSINKAVGQVTNAWNGSQPASVIIVPTTEIPVGTILVCDASKYNSVSYIPYTVRIGWINDDFIHNQFVILAESRFFTYVKKLDEQAFIYDNIHTVRNAIEGVIS